MAFHMSFLFLQLRIRAKQEYITKILCPKIVLRSASKIEM